MRVAGKIDVTGDWKLEITDMVSDHTHQFGVTPDPTAPFVVNVNMPNHGYHTGDTVTITGATPAQYNGTFAITVVDQNNFTYPLPNFPGFVPNGPAVVNWPIVVAPPPPFTGTATVVGVAQRTNDDNVKAVNSVTLSAPSNFLATVHLVNHGFNVGDTVTIAGANQGPYNGAVTIVNVLGPNDFQYVVPSFTIFVSPATGPITVTDSANNVQNIGSGNISCTATYMATVNLTGHGYSSGDQIQIAGATEAQVNGVFTIAVTGADTFTYTINNAPPLASPVPGVITAQRIDGPLTPATVAATSTDYTFVDVANTSVPPAENLLNWSLNFTSNCVTGGDLTIGQANGETIAGASSSPYPTLPAVSPNAGVGPGITIASDNTLGDFSPYQGRLYVAYTTPNMDIALAYSDRGGAANSWIVVSEKVNDDDGTVDHYSGNPANALAVPA